MNTAERREALREALIAAAGRAIAAHGLAGLKARDLASEVGCALGAIYNVFGDLDDLVLAVNAQTLAALEQKLADGAETQPGPLSDEAEAASQRAIDQFVRMALAYIEFAAEHRLRWRAVFEHRMRERKPVPDWYLAGQMRLFAFVERPLQALLPEMPPRETAMLARTLFSAVHGIVTLGLEEKLDAIPLPTLKAQTRLVVTAMGQGLLAEQISSEQDGA